VTLYEDNPDYFYDDSHKKWSLFKENNGQWRLEDLANDTRSNHPSFGAAVSALKSHVGDVTVHRKQARMSPIKTAMITLAQKNPEFRKALLAELRTADKWEDKPKGWTDESRKKFWDSLTSAAPKHKVTECIKRMNKHMGGNAGAFCASLADRVTPGWRQEAAKDKKKASLTQPLSLRRDYGAGSDDEWLGIEEVRKHCPPCADKMAANGIRKVKASALRVAMQR